MFRRAAKEDLKQQDQATGLEMAKSKDKADIRRKILGNREILMKSAKVDVGVSNEFFSSRKHHDPKRSQPDGKKSVIKFQTDSRLVLS